MVGNVEVLPLSYRTALCLSEIAGYTDFSNNNLVVFGGIAYDLLAGAPLVNHKDVDIICKRGFATGLLESRVRAKLGSSSKIDVSMSRLVQVGDEGARLVYRRIVMSVNPQIFEPVPVNFLGTPIPVMRPQTMIRLKSLTHRETSFSERQKRVCLSGALSSFTLPFSEKEYGVFDSFREEIRRRYPLTAVFLLADERRVRTSFSWVKLAHQVPGGRAIARFVREKMLELEQRVVS